MAPRTQYRRKASATVSYAPPSESDSSVDGPSAGSSSSVNKPQKGIREAPPDEQVDSSDSATESSGDDFRPGQTTKKKKRKPRKKAKRAKKADAIAGPAKGPDERVGGLEGIKLVPMEVLLEVVSKSSPGELLSLSQVSQGYRSIVTGDKSDTLWQQARANYELPDITGGGLTELQYASLLFGKGCAACDSNGGSPDFFLRIKLCRTCRQARLVRLDQLAKSNPNVHPLISDCVMQSKYTPGKDRGGEHWAFIADVEYWSNKLWDLEYETDSEPPSEEEDDESASAAIGRQAAAEPGGGAARRQRQRGQRLSYTGLDSDVQTKPAYGTRSRVVRLVEERKTVLAERTTDGDRMATAYIALQKQLRKEETAEFERRQRETRRRMSELERRIRDELGGASESDFAEEAYQSRRLVKSHKPLKDDEWELIKPELFKLIQRNRRRRHKAKALVASQQRQSKLRPAYDKLLDAQPADRMHFMPVFRDFLLFESVRPLWDRPAEPTVAEWGAALSLIIEELEDWRVETVAHAFAATAASATSLEPDSPISELDFEKGGKIDLLESSELVFRFVTCALPWCGVVGSLNDVLQHQHLEHNRMDHLPMKVMKRLTARTTATIPLAATTEVALALTALLDAVGLDPASATSADLDDFQRRLLRWEWENSEGYGRDYACWNILASLAMDLAQLTMLTYHEAAPPSS